MQSLRAAGGNAPLSRRERRNWGCGNRRFLSKQVEKQQQLGSLPSPQAGGPGGQTPCPRARLGHLGRGLTSCKTLSASRRDGSRLREK